MARLFLSGVWAIITFFAAAQASAETVRVGDLVVETAWARASIGTSRPAAAYMTISNTGQSTDILTGVETTVSGMAHIHKTGMKDGAFTMRPVGDLEIPAMGTVKLAPGGLHVMLMKLKQPLKKGEQFLMTLIFKENGRVDVPVRIYSVGASGPKE